MERREFLKNSGVLAGGILLTAPSILSAQAAGRGSALNVALVGLGSQGRILLEAILPIPGINFKAVCDIWEYSRTYGQRKLQREGFKVNAYADLEDMLAKEKDLDAAIIATPDFWHAPQTNACLRAGLHVYCEKMMAHTAESAKTMVETMRETGKLLQIGHQRRSNPRYIHTLERLIRTAKLPGRITNINGQWNRAVSADLGWPQRHAVDAATLKRYGYADMHQFRNWRWFRDLSGGPISDLGAHQIDIFNWFLGTTPSSLIASGGADYFPNREWYDNVMVIYEYQTAEGPVRAFYQVLTTTSAGGGYFEYFMGDEGSVKISENPSFTRVYREDRAPAWDKWVEMNYLRQTAGPAAAAQPAQTVDVRETAPLTAYEVPVVMNKKIHQPHLENFFAAIRGEAELTCPADEAYRSEYAIYAVNPAVENRSLVTFRPEDFEA
jgi:predicted dehydrogenase